MSLQRILETARKTGMPVIMTDLAGREPMVIMPLEQFEAMAGESPASQKAPAPKPLSKEERVVQVLEEMASERRLSHVQDEVPLHIESLSVEIPVPEDLTLEERFYLEPLEDKPKEV